MRRRLAFVLSVTGACWLAAGALPGAANRRPALEDRSRTLSVTVDDGHGGPVTDLAPSDFVVKEGGKVRDVVKAEAATGRIHLALVVSEGVGTYDAARGALAAFIRVMAPSAEMALIQVGQRYGTIVDYTQNGDALVAGLGRVGATYEGPTLEPIMTRGIVEAAKALTAGRAGRPVIVSVILDTDGYWTVPPDELRGVMYDSLKFQPAFSRGARFTTEINQSGGRSETATTPARIGEILRLFAGDLGRQYVLTYVLPDGVKPRADVEVSVVRRGVSLRAPTRVPDR